MVVYATGRSTRGRPSAMRRPETLEETAELAAAAGGTVIPVRVDHTDADEVSRLAQRIREEQDGRLDVLVNDIWGGDPLTEWGRRFWEQQLSNGVEMQRLGVTTHLITSWHLVPLMVAKGRGLIVEITDGVYDDYRGNLYYDLAKASVIRLARAQSADLAGTGVTCIALTPGFLRSEAMLDHFGVTEATWRDAIARDPDFVASETPRYIGRAVAALAGDAAVARWNGRVLSTWQLAAEYGFADVDGRRPDWGAHHAEHVVGEPAPQAAVAAVTVRPCRRDEVDGVLALWRESTEQPTATDDRAGVLQQLERDDSALLVAVRDGVVVGSVIAGWDGWRGNLYRLAVAPATRRRGVARALVGEAERRMRARGVRRIHVGVLQDYESAAAFWRALEYTVDARIARYVKALDADDAGAAGRVSDRRFKKERS